MSQELPLSGLRLVLFESRLADTLCDLVRLKGGEPFSAPSMREIPLEDNPESFLFAEKLLKGEINTVIFLTGVGARALMTTLETRYKKEEILEALRKVIVVPRGPKPIRVLKEWNVPFAVTVPEPNTWKEVLTTLDENVAQIPLKNQVVALQEYGVSNPSLLYGLSDRGAKVLRVPVYRWALPEDLGPLKRAIQNTVDGKMDVAIFTTAVQVDHLFQVAREMKLDKKLREAMQRMVIASVGPDCSEALVSHNLPVDIQPESPKMGPLVMATAEHAKALLEKKKVGGDCASEVRLSILEVAGTDPLDESLFLKACRSEKTDRTPVWLMRQAGRYMQEYKKIRDTTPFLKICKDRNLVTEITVTAQERIDADAAIIFSDILLIAEAFGLGLDYVKGDGPCIHKPICSRKDVENLPDISVRDSFSYVLEAIKQTRTALKPHIPLIGFAGAPFTLASYMIEGGATKDFSKTKNFMTTEKEAWQLLLSKIAEVTIEYLNAQAGAGAQAIQLFDSWAGVLTPYEYETYAFPYSSHIFKSLNTGIPTIHFGTGTGKFLKLFSKAGGDVISVDQNIRLDEAWKEIGPNKAIQGNFDPKILLGDLKGIQKHAKEILDQAAGRPGHIFNLGHGVLPETPVENVIALIQVVKEYTSK